MHAYSNQLTRGQYRLRGQSLMSTIALWMRVPGGSVSELKDDAERNGVGGSSYVNTNLTLTAPDIHPGMYLTH